MGEHSAKTTVKSTMIVESNITYNQELKLNDEQFRIRPRNLGKKMNFGLNINMSY